MFSLFILFSECFCGFALPGELSGGRREAAVCSTGTGRGREGGGGIVGRGLDVLKTPKNGAKICKNVNTSTSVLSALKNLAQKMCKTKMRLKLAQHYAQPIFRGQRNAQGMGKTAFLYYDSWWDTGGIKTEIGGIDPT